MWSRTPAKTWMWVTSEGFKVKVEVLGPKGYWGMKSRRAMMLLAFRRLKPLFKNLPATLEHQDDLNHWDREIRLEDRPRWVSEYQALSIDTPLERIGYRIRMRRHQLGLSQRVLAQTIGMDPTHLSAIERGKHNLRPETRRNLENALGISITNPKFG